MKRFAILVAVALALLPLRALALGGSASSDASATLSDRVVMVLGSRGNSCTGTVIRQGVVLTAAHCVRGAKQVVVAYYENGAPVLQKVARSVIHPQASQNYRRTVDAALVFLEAPLPPRFRPVPLDVGGSFRQPGEAAVIAGFGLQRGSNLKSGGSLRSASVNILPPPARRVMRVGTAARDDLSVCKGDSGGPVFQPRRRAHRHRLRDGGRQAPGSLRRGRPGHPPRADPGLDRREAQALTLPSSQAVPNFRSLIASKSCTPPPTLFVA